MRKYFTHTKSVVQPDVLHIDMRNMGMRRALKNNECGVWGNLPSQSNKHTPSNPLRDLQISQDALKRESKGRTPTIN